MITLIYRHPESGFEWIDVVEPTEKEVLDIASRDGLPKRAVYGALDSHHLPKCEKIGDALFVILRSFDAASPPDADSVQEITTKLAIFIVKNRLITIHRREQKYVKKIRDWWQTEKCPDGVDPMARILYELLQESLKTYQKPIDADIETFEDFEQKSFRMRAPPTVVEDSYYLRRRASVVRRILRSTSDMLSRLQTMGDSSIQGAVLNARAIGDHLYFQADDLQESINSLLNLYISLTSQKANETMKLLTVFSAFFLPLTFIVGVYGMNFRHMPELDWQYGYFIALGAMALTALAIYLWFRRKKLL